VAGTEFGGSEVDRYYERLLEPESLRKEGRPAAALALALELLELVPALIEETARRYGRFDLTSIPPIEEGCILAAILEDPAALERIAVMVAEHRELAPWRDVVSGAQEDMATVALLEQYLAAHPGSIQSRLRSALGCDGRRVSRLVGYMHQAKKVRREPSGRSYALYLVGTGRVG